MSFAGIPVTLSVTVLLNPLVPVTSMSIAPRWVDMMLSVAGLTATVIFAGSRLIT